MVSSFNVISLLIWSKDRACQLDLLLRSLPQNMFFNVCTLYMATSTEYRNGYLQLMDKYSEYFFISEGGLGEEHTGFEERTKNYVKMVADAKGKICLSTDDTVFYRTPTVTKEQIENLNWETNCTFSFRYGLNTVVQNHNTGEIQPVLNVYEKTNNLITWRFDDYHPLHNYGYPFGLDLHVYSSELMLQLMQNIPFSNTNQLESGLFRYTPVVPKLITSEIISSAVNIPCNNMSGITIANQKHNYSIESLNQAFLDGYVIDLKDIQSREYAGCHCEIDLKLVKS